jgi:hypothetical protein
MGLAMDLREIRLGCDRHQGSAIQEGVGDSGDEIRRPGPERRKADARAARQAAVDIGHEGRACFVAREDESDRAVAEGVHEFEILFAWNPERDANAFVL